MAPFFDGQTLFWIMWTDQDQNDWNGFKWQEYLRGTLIFIFTIYLNNWDYLLVSNICFNHLGRLNAIQVTLSWIEMHVKVFAQPCCFSKPSWIYDEFQTINWMCYCIFSQYFSISYYFEFEIIWIVLCLDEDKWCVFLQR